MTDRFQLKFFCGNMTVVGPEDLKSGDVVRVFSNSPLGEFMGEIAGVYPRGVTVWREGVERTKPHFLRFDQVVPVA